MIIYIDYNEGDIKWILKSLKMEGKVNQDIFCGLLDIDFTFDVRTSDIYSPIQIKKIIHEMMQGSILLNKDHMNIDLKWGTMGIMLAKGNYGLMKTYISEFSTL